MLIGEKLKKLREARELSLRALSDGLKKKGVVISYTGLNKWELGETAPTRANLLKICDFYAVEPSWLLYGMSQEDSDSEMQQIIDNLKTMPYKDKRLALSFLKLLVANNTDDDRTVLPKQKENE